MIDEGYIKFELEWRQGKLPDADAVAELNEWRKPLYDAGLIGQYHDIGVGFGNISVRSNNGQFVISGTQTGHLDTLAAEHYTTVTAYDTAANKVCCEGPVKASSESMTHATLYELSNEINAVVHVHSARLWRKFLGKLPTTDPTVSYGTPEMAEAFRRLYLDTVFATNGIAVMAGHDDGIIAIGRNMREAAQRILGLS
ncbi:MAG: class II aldolase/adducin family protein [Woeseia sp.]|nr:class II aldolase/adducin family protein [Woeseia sp.]